ALFLFRNWQRLPILVTGGGRPDSPHADAMRRVLEAEGVPAGMIWVGPNADNTHENAIYSAQILRSKGGSPVALVVEANSMTRARLAFQKAGIDVAPAPTAFTQLTRDYSDWWPGWQGIRANGTSIHEMVGIVWYKLRGWI